jgi:(E)-4-hydroxy-3-methylbut-2-enyl-diphosphate synthase
VRITAPSKKEAEALAPIREALRAQGCTVPLVADIHFTPSAAEAAARIVEKVRVNPGNYADKKKFEEIEYTHESYAAELERIRQKFLPLVRLCKQHGTAMRIGTNHGSLSDRIMSRYGDSPEGMVASALEFVDICESEGFHELVISMKASNALVMVQAYRLLVAQMKQRGTVYPLHLGVTEAGDGEDGRIKSALGIGALLVDGIGDTIRVSLTEAPEAEMPAARYIRDYYLRRAEAEAQAPPPAPALDSALPYNPYAFQRRSTRSVGPFGGDNVPRVVASLQALAPAGGKPLAETDLIPIGHFFSYQQDKWTTTDMAADFLYTGPAPAPFMLPNGLQGILDADAWQALPEDEQRFRYPYFTHPSQLLQGLHPHLNFLRFPSLRALPTLEDEKVLHMLHITPLVLVLEPETAFPERQWRTTLNALTTKGVRAPVVIRWAPEVLPHIHGPNHTPAAAFQLSAACAVAQLCVDGLIDGLWLDTPDPAQFDAGLANRTAFGILQAARLRITKTEYISCPSCGRTLFDLEETTARIRRRTEHLRGVKIGIMGCIVNGPGEMADADYGYVGSGPDVITLYRGKEVVRPKVPTHQAVDALIELITEDGRWFEPQTAGE